MQKDEFSPKMVEIQGGDRNLVPADAVLGMVPLENIINYRSFCCFFLLVSFGHLVIFTVWM